MAHQKIAIEIPDDFKPAQRLELADLVIQHIVERSKDGKDKDGRKFAKYSKEYEVKKGQSNVDLTLSKEMLESIELLKHRPGELVIGFERGSDVNEKAEGNILGTYGQSTPIPGKARNFLGIQDKELRGLIDMVRASGG